MALMDELQTAGEDPNQARMAELIRQLSQPDNPQLLPVPPEQSKGVGVARTGLAALGDILTAIGYSKGGRIPPSQFMSQLAGERDYNRAAKQENTRRITQATIEGKKTGAGLELRDLQKQREEDAAARERDYNNARDRAVQNHVDILDAKGDPKSVAALRKETFAAQKAVDAEKANRGATRLKEHQQRFDLMQKGYQLAAQREARLAKQAGAKGANAARIDPAAKALYDEQWQLETGHLRALLDEKKQHQSMLDYAAADALDPEIQAQEARMQDIMAKRYNATTTTPGTSVTPPAANGKTPSGMWDIQEIKP